MPGITNLVALISLHVTAALVTAGRGLPAQSVTGASNTTPIALSVPLHGFVEPAHVVVAGVLGNTAANGTWVATPTDPNTLALSTYDEFGQPSNSSGSGAYSGGGTVTPALVNGRILLGRQRVAGQDLAPRIVMVPVSSAFGPRSVSGPSNPAGFPDDMTRKQWTNFTIGTDIKRFEVQCWGIANRAQADIEADFDATEALYDQVIASLDALTRGRYKLSGGVWIDQSEDKTHWLNAGHAFKFYVDLATPLPQQIAAVPTAPSGTVSAPVVLLQPADGSPPEQAYP